ncbi:MAG: putative selenate reductase subunit YgfK, partial [Treponema sp.]|nr:putative selenate reductase subunit YgfK [Treponema sp.]
MMSEIMRPIPFPELIRWVQGEYTNHGSVFGIRKEKFFHPATGKLSGANPAAESRINLFGTAISSPVGPAAGPHTQLAQNILAAYLCGARFMELKTVQIMDGEELRKCVARPCINAMDEGYNVEWSTELTVAEAMEEYIKAWFLCHIFAKEFNIAD